jgi:hypothetical protein
LLGIKPSLTLPSLPVAWGEKADAVKKVFTTDFLPGAAERAAQAAKAAEELAAHNARFRAVNSGAWNKIEDLKVAAQKGPLEIENLKPILADREARRTLQASTQTTIKNKAIDAVESQINKPALDGAKQSLTNKYTNVTDPAHPDFKYKKMLDDGYTVEAVDFRTPKPAEVKSFNADGDISGIMVKRDAQGKIIHQVDLPATDVMAAHSESFAKQCKVYNAETKTFNASQASAELGIDFKDPKVLTSGMSKSDLAKFGVNEDLSNVTGKLTDVDKLKLQQLQLNKYNKAYGNGAVGTADADFARDFSTSDTAMKSTPGALPQSTYKAMQASSQGGLVDPQGLAFMERNKVTTNWTEGTVRSQMEAMESLRKMGDAAKKVSAGYSELGNAANVVSAGAKAAGLPPLSENMQAALKIAANRGISPALRAQQIAALNLGDPLTVADKLSAYIESAKMVPGK